MIEETFVFRESDASLKWLRQREQTIHLAEKQEFKILS